MFKWLKLLVMKDPEPMPQATQRCRLDDIEDDIKEIRESLKGFADDVGKAVRELKSRVGELEEKGEWKPQFGDKVWFNHPYFGKTKGICIHDYENGSYQVMWLDPSRDNDTTFCTAKDVEKCND